VIFLAIVVVLGLAGRQGHRYWAHALAAFGMQVVVGFLFYGGGTLDDPTRDGLITAMVRQAANDGPMMGVFGLFVIALGWGVPIWLVVRGYKRRSDEPANDATTAFDEHVHEGT